MKNLAWFLLAAGTLAGALLLPGAWYSRLGDAATWGVLAYALVIVLLALNHAGSWEPGSRNRRLAAAFLIGLPVVYLVCALRAGAPATALVTEGTGLLVWLALAVIGLSRGWALWAGCLAHAGWDAAHMVSAYIPLWYVQACIVVDLAMGLFVLLSLRGTAAAGAAAADTSRPTHG